MNFVKPFSSCERIFEKFSEICVRKLIVTNWDTKRKQMHGLLITDDETLECNFENFTQDHGAFEKAIHYKT